MTVCLGGVGEAEVRDRIRQPTIHLLGHRLVEAPKAGLDVAHLNSHFMGCERGGQRGGHVADYEHQPRFKLLEDWDESCYHHPDLLRSRRRADLQMEVGIRKSELSEEGVGH